MRTISRFGFRLRQAVKKGGQKVVLFSELLLIRKTIDTPYSLFIWFSVTKGTPEDYIDVFKKHINPIK